MRRSGLLQKATATLFAEPIAVSADGDDVAVVEQSIEDGGRDDGIAKDRAPFSHGPVGGHEHGAALIAAADELEEQMRGVGLERQIAELVDNQQFRLGVVGQLFLEPPFAMGLGQLRDQRRRRRECEIACNVGSDSISLQISGDLALLSRRNQRNAARSPPVQPRSALLYRRPV